MGGGRANPNVNWLMCIQARLGWRTIDSLNS